MYEKLRNDAPSKVRGLPTITCSCGAKILLVPNIKKMSEAIEAHVESHKLRITNPARAKEESERIRNNLAKQVLDLASELDRLFCSS